MLDVLLIVVGIALVIWGADKMTEGAVGVASRMGVPQIVIGLTIVAMGTSAPELFISLMSAVKGTPDLAVGNVVGSNIFNTLAIVGVAALVMPITISRTTIFRDLPITVAATIALVLMTLDGVISRIDAAILFAGFIGFMAYTLRLAKKGDTIAEEEQQQPVKPLSMGKAIFFIVLGLACLICGGNIFVNGATGIAKAMGVSDAVIGLTVVALGTSLPELATCVVAARKGNSAIAIGNVIGSNVFNILMILGLTGVVQPMEISDVSALDMAVVAVGAVVMWLFSFTKCLIERWEGAILLLGYVVYVGARIYML